MKITYQDPGLLKPYPRNSRLHSEEQIQALMVGIKEFGFDQPIVVTPGNEIIKGHGRWEASKRLGLKEVPTVIKAVTDNEAKFLRVVDNAVVSEEWDYHALGVELGELAELETPLLEATGFTMADIQALPESPVQPEPKVAQVNLTIPNRECKHCGYKFV